MAAGHRIFENTYFQMVEPPKDSADATVPSSYIDVSGYERFAFIRLVGATDDSAVTMQVVQATAAAGTGSKNITSAAITGTVLAGTNDNKWAAVEVATSKLDIANGFRYVAVTIAATGGSSTLSSVLFIGWRARHNYPTQFAADSAQVVTIDAGPTTATTNYS